MNKRQLVESMAEKMDSTKKVAEDSINAFIDAVTEALLAGEKVNIAGFGTFEVRERKARQGKNPRTGESIQIEASKVPALKVSKVFKKAFNDSEDIDFEESEQGGQED